MFFIMDISSFKKSLGDVGPPPGLTPYLESLWYDAAENWTRSHELIQDLEDNLAAWIHAYLHRKEGDLWNADYWYSKAGKKRPTVGLEAEWTILVDYCLRQLPGLIQ